MCFSQLSLTVLKCITPTVTLCEIVIRIQINKQNTKRGSQPQIFVRLMHYVIIYEEWNDKLKIFKIFANRFVFSGQIIVNSLTNGTLLPVRKVILRQWTTNLQFYNTLKNPPNTVTVVFRMTM